MNIFHHRRKLITVTMLGCVAVLLPFASAQPDETLPGTQPIAWEEEDLSARMMDGAHAFVERQIGESIGKRGRHWRRDFSSPQACSQSVEPNRRHLREIIGAVDERLPAMLEQFGDDANPPLVAETADYSVYQVRWPVLEGVLGEGLWVRPKGATAAHVVVLPDADQTPEELLGLAGEVAKGGDWARRLAENGFEVLVPTLVNRQRLATEDRQLRTSDQTHREWIYRQAFHMGRHVIGYEVQKVLAAVDCFASRGGPGGKIGVAGYGEGGLVAFYAAAVDPRISAAMVSGYFGPRQAVWSEPIYRNVWSLLGEFGDAEIASLVLPRPLIVEYSACPAVTDQKGEIKTPALEEVKAELDRLPGEMKSWGGRAPGPWRRGRNGWTGLGRSARAVRRGAGRSAARAAFRNPPGGAAAGVRSGGAACPRGAAIGRARAAAGGTIGA